MKTAVSFPYLQSGNVFCFARKGHARQAFGLARPLVPFFSAILDPLNVGEAAGCAIPTGRYFGTQAGLIQWLLSERSRIGKIGQAGEDVFPR